MDQDQLDSSPEQRDDSDDGQQFDPYKSSLAQTFKAGQTGEALDFGQVQNENKDDDEDEDERDDDEDDGNQNNESNNAANS